MAKTRRQRKKLQKAAIPNNNNTTSTQRGSKKAISSGGIALIKNVVDTLRPFELSASQRLKTFQRMLASADVWTCYDNRATMLEKTQFRGKFKAVANSEESQILKDFLDYNMSHLTGQSPRSIARAASEMIINGWAPFEVTYKKGSGEYKTLWTLNKLAYIHPLTLDQGKPFDHDGTNILTLRQQGSASQTSGGRLTSGSAIVDIDYRRIVICAYGDTDAAPTGMSNFEAAYTVWREIQLLNDYSLVGVTRDFSGTPVLRVPSEVLEDAAADPNGKEAAQVNDMVNNLAGMSSGENAFMVLPSDSEDGGSMREFDVSFIGVEGGGKNFNIVEMVDQRRKMIYNVFGCENRLSADGGGSFNQLEGQTSIQAHYIERDSMVFEEMINLQLVPKLLAMAGITPTEPTLIPQWVSGAAQKVSYEEYGKFVNRVARVLPAVPEVGNKMLEMLDIDYRVPEGSTPDEVRAMLFEFQDPSKTGSGEGSSGTGSTKQNNSDTNDENK